MKVDVVVVGSGISGLTSAIILAKRGKKVLLCEKQPQFGGALRQFKRQGLAFDVGFHYTGCLGDREFLALLWSYCGVLPGLCPVPLADGYDHFEFSNEKNQVRGYFSYAKLVSELQEKFPQEAAAIDQYFSTVQQICTGVPFYNTALPLVPFLRGYKSRPTSFNKFLQTITSDVRLRAVLTAPGFLYGTPVEDASLEIHSLVAHGYYSGAYTVEGGGQAVVDGFLGKFKAYGGECLAGVSVASVLEKHGKVAGVVLSDGQRVGCPDVIYTAHPSSLLAKVPQGIFRPAYRKRLSGLVNSLSMYAVFGKSEKPLNPLSGPLNHYLLPSDCDVLTGDSNTPQSMRPMMMTGTRTSPGQSLQEAGNGIILLRLGYWQDVERFEVSTPHSRSEEYTNYKEAIGADMVATATSRWGDLTGDITPLAVGTPLSFRDELNAPRGCAYGAMHCLDQFNPDVRTRFPGLYLAGQSTLMTGVVGASISGLVAAGEILGLEPLWEEVTK